MQAKTGMALAVSLLALNAHADMHGSKTAAVPDSVVAEQRANLAKNTESAGFGPQSPRDLRTEDGDNPIDFAEAPSYDKMNLCNIHFHNPAEHAGGEFTRYAGNGDGKGDDTGYEYAGTLSKAELAPVAGEVCPGDYGSLVPGDTIELHYVHSSAEVTPGPTLGACLSEANANPQLRVEGQVFVVVNDENALDFGMLTATGVRDGKQQALNIPDNTGEPIEYDGSTTGPSFNEKGSPLQVSWSVRPKVAKVDIATVAKWCEGNIFDEKAAHGVRNLVKNPALISDLDD